MLFSSNPKSIFPKFVFIVFWIKEFSNWDDSILSDNWFNFDILLTSPWYDAIIGETFWESIWIFFSVERFLSFDLFIIIFDLLIFFLILSFLFSIIILLELLLSLSSVFLILLLLLSLIILLLWFSFTILISLLLLSFILLIFLFWLSLSLLIRHISLQDAVVEKYALSKEKNVENHIALDYQGHIADKDKNLFLNYNSSSVLNRIAYIRAARQVLGMSRYDGTEELVVYRNTFITPLKDKSIDFSVWSYKNEYHQPVITLYDSLGFLEMISKNKQKSIDSLKDEI